MPNQILSSLKLLVTLQLVSGLVLSLFVGWFWGFGLGASFAIGSALMLVNLLLLAWSTWRMLEKKPIAWTLIIIVIKYAVLLGSIVILARQSWFDSMGAGLGIASFLIAILALALIQQKKEI